jgi:peroxiredoxin Q/BCP
MSAMSIQVGDAAPEFVATAHDGSTFSLADFRGRQVVVLFFYPADNTPVCTAEACAFRDAYEDFVAAGAKVVGISSDSTESHSGFAAAHKLPYLLLADSGGEIRKAFGVPKTLGILAGRVTYVIDKQGIVRLVFNSQLAAKGHVTQALRVVQQLSQPA